MRGSGPIDVVVCHPNRFMRTGIRATLDGESSIVVLGEAADARQMARDCRTYGPRVVVLTERFAAETRPRNRRGDGDGEPQFVVLVDRVDPESLSGLIRRGVRALVHLEASQHDLVDAVLAAGHAEPFVSPLLTGALMELVGSAAAPPTPPTAAALTVREAEVFALLVQGLSNSEIAAELEVSVKTVKFHVSNLLAKTHTSTRTQLMASAGQAEPASRPLAPGLTTWSSDQGTAQPEVRLQPGVSGLPTGRGTRSSD